MQFYSKHEDFGWFSVRKNLDKDASVVFTVVIYEDYLQSRASRVVFVYPAQANLDPNLDLHQEIAWGLTWGEVVRNHARTSFGTGVY
jgi:hypothetical protein